MKSKEQIEIMLNIANASQKLEPPHDWFAAFTDIAQTALDLYARVEEMEKELKDSRDIAQVWCDRCYALGYDPMKTP